MGRGAKSFGIPYLKKCFSYILHNSIIFGDKNTPVNVSVQNIQKKVVVTIENKGDGFESGFDINKIVSFVGNNHIDGNPGLSLYLCKLIVNAHGGTIVNENTSNGTFLTINL
ncbi:MAG: hypothetical protein HQ522_06250 [Bacteroidetes bacterium]|nr:hypothetical protein [Bacteroidota bacterium]